MGKKILAMLLGDKNGRKALVYILGIALVIVLLPFIATLGLFGWMAGSMASDILTPEAVYAELPEDVRANIAQYEPQLEQIESEFYNAGYSANDISKAKTIYVSALVGKETEEGFYQTYMACFQGVTTNAELLTNVSSAFGVNFSDADRDEFENLFGGNG